MCTVYLALPRLLCSASSPIVTIVNMTQSSTALLTSTRSNHIPFFTPMHTVTRELS